MTMEMLSRVVNLIKLQNRIEKEDNYPNYYKLNEIVLTAMVAIIFLPKF